MNNSWDEQMIGTCCKAGQRNLEHWYGTMVIQYIQFDKNGAVKDHRKYIYINNIKEVVLKKQITTGKIFKEDYVQK